MTRRYQLAAGPHASDGESGRVHTSDMQQIVAECDTLQTLMDATLILTAAEDRQDPFTAADILHELKNADAQSAPSLQAVEHHLAKLHALGILSVDHLH
jgi:hypothetical protein